jgi:monoamine oxidase
VTGRSRGFSRRAFLGGLAATTALGAAACARPPATTARVAVLGAGLAGLTCAHRLARQGVDVTVYEARDRVGGRVWSTTDLFPGQVAEHGGELVFGYGTRQRDLVAELGLQLEDVTADSRSDLRSVYQVGGRVVDAATAYDGFDAVLERVYAEAARVGPWRFDGASDAARELDAMSAHDWIDQYVPGGAASTLGTALRLDMVHYWGGDARDLSAVHVLLSYLPAEDAGTADAMSFFHVRGGNQQIADRLAAGLPAGRVVLGSAVEAVRRRGDGYELVVGGRPVTADVVVTTLPFPALRAVDLSGLDLDAPRRDAIEQLGMGDKAKLTLQFTEPFAAHGWSGGVESDAPAGHSWDSSRGQGGPGLLSWFATGEAERALPTRRPHGPAPQPLVDATLAQLDGWVPGVAASFSGRAWLDRWSQDPWAGGVFPYFRPGQVTRFWGLLGQPVGRLFFAGDQTSTRRLGSMAGAVESGEDAAAGVLSALGRPPAPDPNQ